jgi:hypothetical protein
MAIMKLKYLMHLALAGVLVSGTALAVENQNQQQQGGKPAQVRTGGGGKVNAGGAQIRAQSQGEARFNRGNINRGNNPNFNRNNAARIQNQNRITVRERQFNRNATNRNVINRNATNREFHRNRNATNREIMRNRANVQQQNFKQHSVQRNERNRIRTGERTRTNRQAAVQISQTQRMHIRESFRRHHWHRVARVGFPIFVGATWPRDYAVYDVPQDFVEYVPDYEGYKYIVVGNELLIIDPETWEIVAVIPV